MNHLEIGFHWKVINLEKSLQHWINDGLMAIFFLLIGLEVKRELLLGELSTLGKALLPIVAALGGMAVPALLYVAFNHGSSEQLLGWAIPSATDIAFALGILSLMGSRVPKPLFIFLAAIAIADDLGAILIIALFYNQSLNGLFLLLSAVFLIVLMVFNYTGVKALRWYGLVGILLWYCVMQSGIHATIAGVLLALTIPARCQNSAKLAPLQRLEHALHAPVNYAIVPVFVLFNAGVSLSGVSLSSVIASPVTLGVIVGLVVGKCVGIFGVTSVFVRMRWIQLSTGVRLRQYLSVSLLAGIGFTMSIFISELAFPAHPELLLEAKMGILLGSLTAGLLGCLLIFLGEKHGRN